MNNRILKFFEFLVKMIRRGGFPVSLLAVVLGVVLLHLSIPFSRALLTRSSNATDRT